ncbi:MAG: hypothetical protein V1746_07315 [bacterium]
MNIEVAVLCDAATDSHGKLNILGVFNTIFARQFPVIHPHCAVALRVNFQKAEEGAHAIKAEFVNADGQPIMPTCRIAAEVKVPDDLASISCNFIVNIQGLKLNQPGDYSVDIFVDDAEATSIPLLAKQVSAPPV